MDCGRVRDCGKHCGTGMDCGMDCGVLREGDARLRERCGTGTCLDREEGENAGMLREGREAGGETAGGRRETAGELRGWTCLDRDEDKKAACGRGARRARLRVCGRGGLERDTQRRCVYGEYLVRLALSLL